jgi:hypothetical protein
MTDSYDSAAPTRDSDTVETDAHAGNSAEDLDEDRLRVDPLEAGMDPPERWMGADKYGVTPYEQSHPRPLDERLDEEESDDRELVEAVHEPSGEASGGVLDEQAEELNEPDAPADPDEPQDPDLDQEVLREAEERGQLGDEAGGSVAAVTRMPDPPE